MFVTVCSDVLAYRLRRAWVTRGACCQLLRSPGWLDIPNCTKSQFVVIGTRLSTNECTGAQRRATILDRHGVPHDTVLLPREDFPFRQDARSCAAQLGWSAGGEMLAVLPHRCRSIVLWRAITLESQAFEIAHKVFMHRME